MITQIQLGQLGFLDVAENVNVPLNFSIAEIQDISKRQGGFSKTIKLPGTANNNNLLGHLFDVNIADASFNINIKQKCQIIQNGVVVFEGYLQLMNVNKITPSQGNPDEFVEYEANVRDDSGTFYSSMQEKLLTDLPYWDQYNHIYTLSAITATSANTVSDAYTYILPWKSVGQYNLTDFAPAIYAKAYWDRIFLDAGYTYQWDSLESCSFDKLIIPYNGDTPTANYIDYAFRAGFLSGSIAQTITVSGNSVDDTNYVTTNLNVIYNDDLNSPNFDIDGNFNPTTGIYTSNIGNVNAEFVGKYVYELQWNAPQQCYFKGMPVVGQNSEGRIIAKLENKIVRNGVEQITGNSIFLEELVNGASTTNPYNIPVGISTIFEAETTQFSSLFPLFVGDQIRVKLKAYYQYLGFWFKFDGDPLPDADIPELIINVRIAPKNDDKNYFRNNMVGNLNEGQLVEISKFIPKQIKQKDFIASVVKMFNLYLTPDTNVDNNLIIQTRDEYYDSGEIIDWTDKYSIDADSNLQFLPDLQDKRLILSYKQDGDEWNKQYQLATGEVYGQVQYEFENEFTQSTKRIEPIFSPTPIITSFNNLLVPAILNQNPKNNLRILYYDGWKSGGWFFQKINFTGGTTDILLNSYPRALHFDDPINPTIDINFAQPDYYGYSNYETVTDNNLYNKYWSRFINQIETGKLLSGTFYLTENDINQLKLNSKVWLHDAYWNINKITDYNANSNGLTKVELISVDNGLQFNPFPIKKQDPANPVIDVGPKNNWIYNQVSILDGATKNQFGTIVTNTTVNGIENILQGATRNSLIVGDGNRYAGQGGTVIGDNNNIEGNGIIAIGVNNQTFTGQSNTTYFGNPVVATTISATSVNINGEIYSGQTSVWIEGTGGVSGYAIKANNDSTTDATGDYAVAEGFNTLASGNNSHAEGESTTASGLDSHAEGGSTTASNNYTHAEGESTFAQGQNSHAQGKGSNALGYYSHAGGNYSKAQYDGEISSNGITSSTLGRTQFGQVNTIGFTTNAVPILIDFNTGALAQNGFAPPIAVTSVTDLAMSFTYQIVCFKTATGDARIVTGEGIIKWIGGTPTLVFASAPASNGNAGLAAIAVAPVASGLGLQFQVTGIAASNLRWTLRMDYNW